MKKLLLLTSLLISGSLWADDEFPPCEGDHMTWTACTYASDSMKYSGEFYNGKMHGTGTLSWASGNKYVGEMYNGAQHGKGTIYWHEGDVYQGEYFAGKKHGKGLCKLSEEAIKKAKKGKFKGLINYKKGQTIYECSFINGDYASVQKANPDSFLYGVFKAALSGVVQGAIEGAINGECEMSTTSKTRQVIPGSPQYGQKTTTRTTSKNCN